MRLGQRKELCSSSYKNLASFQDLFQLSSVNSQNDIHSIRLKFNVSQRRPKTDLRKKTAKLCLGSKAAKSHFLISLFYLLPVSSNNIISNPGPHSNQHY